VRNFTCAVGIFLTSVTSPFSGNLSVFPGSHHVLEQYFKNPKHLQNLRDKGGQCLIEAKIVNNFPQPLQQLTVQAGDMVILNYNLAHLVAPNKSGTERVAVYFRIKAQNTEEYNGLNMNNIWQEWKGMNVND